MGERLGLGSHEVQAEVLPADKAQAVQQLRADGSVVVMVGDGVNDAPALAAADVGMAMGTGTDVAMNAAGVTLMRGELTLVGAALDISSRTVSKIRQNLFWAFVYNVAGIALAATGGLNPMVAGAATVLPPADLVAEKAAHGPALASCLRFAGPAPQVCRRPRTGHDRRPPFAGLACQWETNHASFEIRRTGAACRRLRLDQPGWQRRSVHAGPSAGR
jgi:hypothetical protein